jgi:hypothetical protein
MLTKSEFFHSSLNNTDIKLRISGNNQSINRYLKHFTIKTAKNTLFPNKYNLLNLSQLLKRDLILVLYRSTNFIYI